MPNPTGMNPFAMQSNPAIPSQVPVQNPGANNMWQGESLQQAKHINGCAIVHVCIW